jgi:hypothetical protein
MSGRSAASTLPFGGEPPSLNSLDFDPLPERPQLHRPLSRTYKRPLNEYSYARKAVRAAVQSEL